MMQIMSEVLLEWMTRASGFQVSSEGPIIAKSLVHLISLASVNSNEAILSSACPSPFCHTVCTFLDNSFHFPASCLFNLKQIEDNSASEEDIFGLCLTVLLGCLQSKNKQVFMDAALEMDIDKQRIVFHLVREPMTQLTADRFVTRESILSGFRHSVPSPHSLSVQAESLDRSVVAPLVDDLQSTPIKSVSNDSTFKKADAMESNILYISRPNSMPESLESSLTSLSLPRAPSTGCISTDSAIVRRLLPDSIGKVECTVDDPLAEPDAIDPSISQGSACYQQYLPTSTATLFKRPNACSYHLKRPTNLTLMTNVTSPTQRLAKELATSGNQLALPDSPCGDSMDSLSFKKLQSLPPLASPLTSVKHLVDSPLWSHKIRLREVERERRRLQTDLETERVYRDEAEHTIAEMRQQLDEACKRAAEAESRAGRLTRQLNSQQDQQDEFLACKAELALREEEIDSLTKRLTSFQDLVSHARKLNVENVNLQQECADRQQKIDQLTSKLSETKSQRIVCSELETLRTKLRDAEAQLAQQLLDSESVENEARRQQEMYHHLRLQHSMAKMRLTAKNEQLESNTGRAEQCPVTPGENLGAVLESELQSVQSEVARLSVELSSVMTKLSARDSEVEQFTSRLSELVSDLADASAQREMTEMALRTARGQLQVLQSDTETLQARLEAWHCPATTANDIDAGSLMSSPLEELNAMASDLDDNVSGLLSTCLLRINEFFTNHITSVVEYVRETSKEEERNAFSAKQLASDTAHDALVQQLQSVKTELAIYQTKYETAAEQLSNAMTSVQAQTQLAAQLQKTVAALESEKQIVESSLTELQERSNKELQASRELLDSATSRLRELETELSRCRNAADVRDVAVSTELWTVGTTTHLPEDELEADDLDEAVDHEGVEEVDPCVEHAAAYEALAADRRGLSDELVRLHDELSDANTYTVHLERQVTELQDKLATCEEDLCRQTALLTRAQENWAIVERERRDTEQNLADLRNMYSIELQALGADLLPQINRTRAEASATAAQVDAVSAKLQAERVEFKNKLARATYELEAMNTDKLLLSERNDYLQREVDNLRVLVIKMATGVAPNNGIAAQSYSADRHRPSEVLQAVLTAGPSEQPNSSAPAEAGGSLEKWLEVTCESRSRGKATEPPPVKLPEPRLSDTPSSSMSSRHLDSSGGGGERCSDGDGLSQVVSRRADVIRYLQQADGGFPGYSCQTNSRFRQATGLEQHGVLQLSSAQQHRASRQTSSQMSSVAMTDPADHLPTNGLDSTSYSAPLVRLDRLAAINELHNREKQQQQALVRRQDLDTDADSSAYTDLSQVSVRSHPSRMLRNPQPTGYPSQNISPSADATLLAYRDSTNLSSVSPRKSHTLEPDSASMSDPTRINELHRRNRLQPLHLRTSYPVETQSVDPLQVADALSHLSSTDRANQRPLSKKAQENLGNVLREVDEENVLFDQRGEPSPLAAGYREPPKDLHSITNALIAASDDPHNMVAALAAQLSHTSAQMGAPAEVGAPSRLRCPGPTSSLAALTGRGSQKPVSRLSSKPQPSLDEVEQFTRLHLKSLTSATSSRAPTRPVSAIWIPVTDENFHPPQPPFSGGSGSTGRLAHSTTTNDTAVAGCSGLHYYPRGGQRTLSSSDDEQSVCSSVRSSKGSVAFEIPVNDGENNVRRGLPHRRVLSSSQQVSSRGDAHKNNAVKFVAPNHCSNLKMATTTLPRATASRRHKAKLGGGTAPSAR